MNLKSENNIQEAGIKLGSNSVSGYKALERKRESEMELRQNRN